MIIAQGDLEKIILNAVWGIEENTDESIDVAYVRNYINLNSSKRKWAYTTVKTVLDRLVDKRIISRSKCGKKYCYSSIVSREKSAATALEKVARQYFDGDLNSLIIFAESLAARKPVGQVKG